MSVVCGASGTKTGGSLRSIENAVFAHGFDVATLRDDVAVITLSASVLGNDYAYPTLLARTEPEYYRYAVLVSFETTADPLRDSPLHGLGVLMVPVHQCAAGLRRRVGLCDMFCGMIGINDQISLSDIGAPLVYHGRLVGIVSSTAAPDYPHAFFVDVHKFLDFINDTLVD